MALAARKPDSEYVYSRASAMRVYTHRTACEVQAEEPRPKAVPGGRPIQKLVVTFAILAAATAVVLVMARYAVITKQYSLVNEYKENIAENDRLLKELEVKLNSAVSLEEAREAALAAGLWYPSASQIVKIDGSDTGGNPDAPR